MGTLPHTPLPPAITLLTSKAIFSGVLGYLAAISLYAGPTILVSAVWQVPQSLLLISAEPGGSLAGGAVVVVLSLAVLPLLSADELLQAIVQTKMPIAKKEYIFFNGRFFENSYWCQQVQMYKIKVYAGSAGYRFSNPFKKAVLPTFNQ